MCVLSLCWQKVETQDFASHKKVSTIYIDGNMLIEIEFVARETQDFALLSQQFFNIASKGLFFGVVLTDCYISNKYGQSVQSFFCAPITELCRVMSSFSAACSVSDTLTRFAKS